VSVASNGSGNGSAAGTTGSAGSGPASGGSLVSVQLPGSVNAPVSALSNASGNGSAGLGL
jgi:hypothetical protein